MTQTAYCPKHKDTPTNLRCGKCSELVCPRCLVHTPVGVRCTDCAQVKRPPTYDVPRGFLARAVAAGIGLGIAGGIGLIVLQPLTFGFFYLIIAAGLGYVVAEGVSLSANRKRGRMLQYVASGGVALSFGILLALGSFGLFEIFFNLFDILAAAVAVYAAFLRLR